MSDARLGMAQNIGGSGATVVTTILEAATRGDAGLQKDCAKRGLLRQSDVMQLTCDANAAGPILDLINMQNRKVNNASHANWENSKAAATRLW